MFGLGLLGSLATLVGSIAPAVASYFAAGKQVEAQEFASMSQAEREEYVAYAQATSALNAAKASNNHTAAAQVMVYLFGLPAALHWGATFVSATFPQLGFHTDPLHGNYADAERDIALSFFLLAPTIPIVGSLASRLRA